MTDHFAALDQPCRPWLDLAQLKDHFHALTATLHPDIPATGDASRSGTLNAAYQVLREPASRLRHLLELESAASPESHPAVPASIASRFMNIAMLRQSFDALATQQRNASHPLQRALLTPQRVDLEKQLAAVSKDLAEVQKHATAELQSADAAWAENRAAVLPSLVRLQAEFAYLSRWIAQLEEMRFQLESMR